jgi:hypothetical protein
MRREFGEYNKILMRIYHREQNRNKFVLSKKIIKSGGYLRFYAYLCYAVLQSNGTYK